jgi:hypothetical protein
LNRIVPPLAIVVMTSFFLHLDKSEMMDLSKVDEKLAPESR